MGSAGHAIETVGAGAMGATVTPFVKAGLGYADKKGAFGTFTKGRKLAEDAANQARGDANSQQAQIDQAVTKLNAEYGVGDSAEAQANKTTQDATIAGFGKTTEKVNADQVNQGFQDQNVANRQNLARSGMLNSSVDVGAQRKNLGALIAGRQRAVAAGQGAARDLTMSTEGNRLSLVSQIQDGTLANPDFNAMAAQKNLQLQSATANVIPQAIGAGFTAAGGDYEQNANAVDKGAGFPSLTLTGQPTTTPSPSGSLTK